MRGGSLRPVGGAHRRLSAFLRCRNGVHHQPPILRLFELSSAPEHSASSVPDFRETSASLVHLNLLYCVLTRCGLNNDSNALQVNIVSCRARKAVEEFLSPGGKFILMLYSMENNSNIQRFTQGSDAMPGFLISIHVIDERQALRVWYGLGCPANLRATCSKS